MIMNLIVTSPGPAPGEAPMDTAGSSSGEGRASMKTLSGILKHITTTRATRQDDNPDASPEPRAEGDNGNQPIPVPATPQCR